MPEPLYSIDEIRRQAEEAQNRANQRREIEARKKYLIPTAVMIILIIAVVWALIILMGWVMMEPTTP